MVSDDYIYEKILNISENEYKEMRKQLINDKKRQYRYETIERDGNDPAKNNNAEQNNNSNSNP
jgi:hypothetical protein